MQSPSKQFITELTADNSPTLRLISSATSKPESMHHSGGAATETKYIYGEAILKALTFQKDLNFLVVGLGLGYIEILISSLIENAKIESYEIDEELRTHFLDWVKGSEQLEIYNLVCKNLNVNNAQVRSRVAALTLN
jgi:protein-L-isoaspartate O-methyltransferase